MTIIVYVNGVVAADRLVRDGNYTSETCKLHVQPDGSVIGCAGYARDIAEFLSTGELSARTDTVFKALKIKPSFEVITYDDGPFPFSLGKESFACTGAQEACFAAHILYRLGYSASDIVRIISQEQGFAGLDVAAYNQVSMKWEIINVTQAYPKQGEHHD